MDTGGATGTSVGCAVAGSILLSFGVPHSALVERCTRRKSSSG